MIPVYVHVHAVAKHFRGSGIELINMDWIAVNVHLAVFAQPTDGSVRLSHAINGSESDISPVFTFPRYRTASYPVRLAFAPRTPVHANAAVSSSHQNPASPAGIYTASEHFSNLDQTSCRTPGTCVWIHGSTKHPGLCKSQKKRASRGHPRQEIGTTSRPGMHRLQFIMKTGSSSLLHLSSFPHPNACPCTGVEGWVLSDRSPSMEC